MKKQIVLRLALIGALHAFLYLWFIPFVVYPRFGDNGFKMAVAVALIISFAALGTLLTKNKPGNGRK